MLRAILDYGQSILDEVSLTIRRENHVWLGLFGKGNTAAHYFGLGKNCIESQGLQKRLDLCDGNWAR
jgi:hypothetical protein